MDFLSIHELSTQFDTPARVIRYRFHKLRLAGKLAEEQDYRREDFVDDQHFEWKINPLSFMRATGMALSPIAKRTAPAAAGSSVATKETPVVTQTDNQPAPAVNHSATKTATVDNQVPDAATKPVNQPEPKPTPTGLEREMITLLKEQVTVKDGQINDLTDQNKKLNDLNVKLVGTTIQQTQQIQNLLRLTGGAMEFSEFVTKDGQPTATAGNHPVTKTARTVNQPADEGEPMATSFVDHEPSAATHDADDATNTTAQAA